MWAKVKLEELFDMETLERKLGGKVLKGDVYPHYAEVEYEPVATLSWFVTVWDCDATITTADDDGQLGRSLAQYKETATYQAVVNKVVYEDNSGAINISGMYYPKSQESLDLFEALLEETSSVNRG